MAINVSQAFHRTSANPVDDSMALTKAQMLTVNDNLMPAYYFTICQDDGKIYLYDKSATASVTTGKFKEFEGGGGGGTGSGITIDATLLASGWNSSTNQQTVTFTGYESSMGGVIGMPVAATAAQKTAYAEAVINVVSQSGTSFTFECENIPSIDLPVTLYAGGGSGGGGGTASLFTITVTTNDGEHFTADKTPTEVETAFNNDGVVQVLFPMYGMTLHPAVVNTTNGMYVFSTMYTEGTSSATAFCSILLAKDTATTWTDIGYQTIMGDALGGSGVPEGGTTGQALVKKSNTDGDVEWKDVVGQFSTFPSPSAAYANTIIQYTGTTNGSKKNGHFYTCVSDGSDYRWAEIDVQTVDPIQYSTMPTPEGSLVGKIVQYVGETTTTAPIYVNGLFYKCIIKSTSPMVYEWVQCDVQTYPEADLTNVFASGMPSANMTGQQIHYSTQEQVIGTWIDGKPLYQKVIDCGALPNATSKNVLHGVDNIKRIVNINGYAYDSSTSGPWSWPFPGFVVSNGEFNTDAIMVYGEGDHIKITTYRNYSSYSESYVIIQYTKTTD